MKKKLITSALPYVNNVPHLGNIIGCVLSADVYARICRQLGYETLYICATDEYGTATENKAREEGVTPKEICDKYHKIHHQVYKFFNISFDFFGRTSSPEHTKITQDIYSELDRMGLIEEQETEQTYCEKDQMFLADRYVEGNCPHCNYAEARGDQCDQCGKLLQPAELKDPKCKVCGHTPSRKLTRHLYLNLPALEDDLQKFHQKSISEGHWSANAISVAKSWLKKGLILRPITRDLSWGVKVPRKGYENKVFYVWFDAPIGYISSTLKGLSDDWKRWWQSPETTELYQFMAKDNILFHTVIFPATLMGTGKKWTLLHHINSTEYLNYENSKFSKSRGLGVFGTDVMKLDIPIDLWRFYLLFNRPEKSDSNFSWDQFLEDINNNFIDNIGNLVNRVLLFYRRYFGDKLSDVTFTPPQMEFLQNLRKTGLEITQSMEEVKIKDSLKMILALGKKGNKFFQESRPWETIKSSEETTKSLLLVLLYLVRDVGILLAPFMPDTSNRILQMLNCQPLPLNQVGNWDDLKNGSLGEPELLFKKLQAADIAKYKEKFNGQQSTEVDPLEAWKSVELKVGKILSVKKHPTADRLYIETIDCGEKKHRTVVSGLVKYYTEDELLGKKVMVVSNLKPAELRGVVSEGMLLTAEKRKKLEVIDLGDYKVGAVITLEDHQNEPVNSLEIEDFMNCRISVKNYNLQIADKNLQIEGKTIKTEIISNGRVR
jgi:methionyl-tRNA synthetase